MKKNIGIFFVLISFLSCNSKTSSWDSEQDSIGIYNDDVNKPFKERIIKYADFYCKNNLKIFSGTEMNITTSDILRVPGKSQKNEEFYVFTYTSHSADLKYVLDGEVIIKFENNVFSLKKDYLHNNDDYITIDNSVYLNSIVNENTKVLFSEKY